MTVDKSVAQELPDLRRFARLVIGHQRAGDAYVGCMLEKLLLNPSIIARGGSVKVCLLHQLSGILASASEKRRDNGFRAFDLRAHKTRQAWLLFAVEQLAVEDIAEVLDLSTADVRAMLAETARTIREISRTDVVIVDDDLLASAELGAIVQSLGHRVMGTARSSHQALDLLAHRRPGLILAEARLIEKGAWTGDWADTRRAFPAPAILMTSMPEGLLTGLRPEPALLLSKPFDDLQVEAMIAQALQFDDRARALDAWRDNAALARRTISTPYSRRVAPARRTARQS